MLSHFVLVAVLVYRCAYPVQSAGSCAITPASRKECGFPGIPRELCQFRSCCFDSSIRNARWCFQNNDGCVVSPADRLECGHPGISKRGCETRGCCFDNSVRNAKWCFLNKEKTASSHANSSVGSCAIAPTGRKECGFPGIPRDLCQSRSCCFDSSIRKAYWCFQHSNVCVVNPTDRQECGHPGISRRDCETRGCCYDDSFGNAKWCFLNKEKRGRLKVRMCDVQPVNRRECGFPGISRDLCRSRSCCYDGSVRNTYHCFQHSNGCVVSPADRLECGHPGISRRDCETRGCCYDTSFRNAKWCFLNKEKTVRLKGRD